MLNDLTINENINYQIILSLRRKTSSPQFFPFYVWKEEVEEIETRNSYY